MINYVFFSGYNILFSKTYCKFNKIMLKNNGLFHEGI